MGERTLRATTVLVFALAAACKGGTSSENVDGATAPAQSASAAPVHAKSDRPALVMDHVTLLEPEAVIEKRILDQDAFAAAIKGATNAVIAYDASHVDALPAELDVVLVARPGGLRVWLVGAKGDLAAPDLQSGFASLPKVAVRDGNVAAVATLARVGPKPAPRAPYLPAAWKAAAGTKGAAIDDVIDASWPH